MFLCPLSPPPPLFALCDSSHCISPEWQQQVADTGDISRHSSPSEAQHHTRLPEVKRRAAHGTNAFLINSVSCQRLNCDWRHNTSPGTARGHHSPSLYHCSPFNSSTRLNPQTGTRRQLLLLNDWYRYEWSGASIWGWTSIQTGTISFLFYILRCDVLKRWRLSL